MLSNIFLIFTYFLMILGISGLTYHHGNFLLVLLALEVVLLGANLSFLYLSLIHSQVAGQIFSIIVLTLAAAESALGLGLLIGFFRLRGSIAIGAAALLRG